MRWSINHRANEMIKTIYIILYLIFIGLLAEVALDIGFINIDFKDNFFLEKWMFLLASIIWLYEYKYDLPMVVGAGVFKVKDVKERKFFLILALLLFVCSVIFLVFGIWPWH